MTHDVAFLASYAEEFVDRIRQRDQAVRTAQETIARLETRVAAMEAFIRENGHEVRDAERAWNDKGYAL